MAVDRRASQTLTAPFRSRLLPKVFSDATTVHMTSFPRSTALARAEVAVQAGPVKRQWQMVKRCLGQGVAKANTSVRARLGLSASLGKDREVCPGILFNQADEPEVLKTSPTVHCSGRWPNESQPSR